jgi:hypothetical protein
VILDDIIGVWESGKAPDVIASLTTFNCGLAGGELNVNSATKIKLTGGALKASGLSLNSQKDPPITGTVASVAIQFGASTVGVPDSIVAHTREGGTFASDGELKIIPGKRYPVGRYRFVVPIEKVLNHQTESFALIGGKLTLPLENREDGQVVSPGKSGKDDSFIVEPSDRISLTGSELWFSVAADRFLKMGVDLRNGRIIPGTTSIFRGDLEGQILGGMMLVATKSQGVPKEGGVAGFDWDDKHHDDARLYSVRLSVNVPKPTGKFGPSEVRFTRGAVNLAFETAVAFQLIVPEGEGEYKDQDDPSKGGKKEDDQAKSQEVFSDRTLIGRSHLYLKPKTYDFTARLKVSWNPADLRVLIDSFDTKDSFDTLIDKSFGAKFLVPIAGAIVGTIVGGPVGTVVGAAGGFVVNKILWDKIEGLIGSKLVEAIHGFSQEWHVTLTPSELKELRQKLR